MSAKVTQLHFYTAADGQIQVYMADMDMWLSQKQMALLFGVEVKTISEHIGNVMRTDELDPVSTIRKIRIVQDEGGHAVARYVNHYNLEVVTSVGFRVNSAKATHFRRWANGVIRDYLTKGVVINVPRLENLDDETLDRVSKHSLKAIVNSFRGRGESDEKIRARLNGIVSRNDVTDMLWTRTKDRVSLNIGLFTNRTYEGLFRRNAKQLKLENGGFEPRDGMTIQGLDFLSVVESTVADKLKERKYVYFFEALTILDAVCREVFPAIQGVQTILGVDLGTSQPLLPDGKDSA